MPDEFKERAIVKVMVQCQYLDVEKEPHDPDWLLVGEDSIGCLKFEISEIGELFHSICHHVEETLKTNRKDVAGRTRRVIEDILEDHLPEGIL